MYNETLEKLGLSPNEASVYEALIVLGKASITQVSIKANVNRRNIYDVINRLLEKGLVFQIFQKGENIYEAVNPDKLFELIREKERALETILPELKENYLAQHSEEVAFIYKGLEGFKNYMRDMERVGEPVYFIAAKALWFTPGVPKHFLENFKKTMKKKKVKYYTIFDPIVKEQKPEYIDNVGGEYKIFPKKYSTPGVCDIFGDYVVTFNSVDVGNFGDEGTIFVMKNKKLAENFRTWFQFMWDNLPEEKVKKNIK